MSEILAEIAGAAWGTLLEMSPYLLFGFALAGLLSVFISPEAVVVGKDLDIEALLGSVRELGYEAAVKGEGDDGKGG